MGKDEIGRWIIEDFLKKRSLDFIREDGDMVGFAF